MNAHNIFSLHFLRARIGGKEKKENEERNVDLGRVRASITRSARAARRSFRSCPYRCPSYVDVIGKQGVLHITNKTNSRPENISAHVYPTVHPFTGSSTSANAGFRSRLLKERSRLQQQLEQLHNSCSLYTPAAE